LPTFQWHGGYNWRPGLWLAADVTYFTGGQTSVNGVQDNDVQRNVRYGLTLSFRFLLNGREARVVTWG